MRITAKDIEEVVKTLVLQANSALPPDILSAFAKAQAEETSATARLLLDIIAVNSALAQEKGLPICQDTGIDTIFVGLGSRLSLPFNVTEAINRGVAKATTEGYLRASVCDPITRQNSGNNTPGVIHFELEQGEKLEITVLPKGCGSENMSALFMLPPSVGIEGVVEAVVSQVKKAGPNPCPPGIIGVGLGGTMEQASLLAKKALLRPLGVPNAREDAARLEKKILKQINQLAIGPLGLGGTVSALGVNVELYPCHIASLPVAVNIQCHAARRAAALWNGARWEFKNNINPKHNIKGKKEELIKEISKKAVSVTLPLARESAADLRAGQWLLLNGTIYTGRDQTHRRLVQLLENNAPLPVDLKGQLIYYVGPSPAPPGLPVGSAGPTTSYRMDAYTPRLLKEGVLMLMGKGRRSEEVKKSLREEKGVYLATIGGAGAFLASCIEECEMIAFPELGPEALYKMKVKNFPAVVINDSTGGDLYEKRSQ